MVSRLVNNRRFSSDSSLKESQGNLLYRLSREMPKHLRGKLNTFIEPLIKQGVSDSDGKIS
jgi:hypothetical protein